MDLSIFFIHFYFFKGKASKKSQTHASTLFKAAKLFIF